MSPREGLSFNVLVSDIGLPGMDGYELMQHIRKDLKVPATRLPRLP